MEDHNLLDFSRRELNMKKKQVRLVMLSVLKKKKLLIYLVTASTT